MWLPIFVASVALRKADRVGLLSSICCSMLSMLPWARNSKVAQRADNMINMRYIYFWVNGLMGERGREVVKTTSNKDEGGG